MGKKGKKYALRDIRAALQKKKYGQANQFFSNVRIKKGQEEEAQSLQHTIVCGLAFKYFQNREYDKCILHIEGSLPELSDHLQLFKGLSHLFLKQYDIATALLQPIIEKPSFTTFRFYYLLGLIYQGKGEELVGVNELPKTRQQFLAVAQMLQQKKYKEATELLDKLEPQSNSAFQNKKLLLDILKGHGINVLKENPKLRTLYRAMASIALSKSEIAYLSSFSELTQQYQLSTSSQKEIDLQEIIDDVHRLCNEGVPLSQEALHKCLNAPTEILPHLLFNHIATLFNKDKVKYQDEIYALIREQYEHLCKVPEFIFLLSELLDITEEEEIPAHLGSIIKQYIDYFKDSWTIEKAAKVSVSISKIFIDAQKESSPDKTIKILGQQYLINPNLITLSWDCFALYCTSPHSSIIKWSYLSLFTRELEPVAKAMIRDDLVGMLGMIKMTSTSSSLPLGFLENGFSLSQIGDMMTSQTLQMFEQLLVKQTPLPSDNFPLELLLIIGEQINLTKNIEQFKSIWVKYAEHFKEPVDSILQKKYNKLISDTALASEDYKKFFKSKANFTQSQKEGKDLVEVLNIETARIVKQIDKSHFDDDLLFEIKILLKNAVQGIKYGIEEEQVIKVFEKFMQQYVNLCKNFDCGHPLDFFYELIDEILVVTPFTEIHLLVIEAFLKKGDQFIFDNSELDDYHIGILTKYVEICFTLISKEPSISIDPIFSKKISKLLDDLN